MDWADVLKSKGGGPIRRVAKVVERRDPESGEKTQHVLSQTDIVLGVDGETEIYEFDAPTQTWDCMHPISQPFGGQCVDTGQQCCVDCIVRCGDLRESRIYGLVPGNYVHAGCGKPVSRQAAHQTKIDGQMVLLCRQCRFEHKRSRRRRAVLRTLLETFFHVDERQR